MARPYITVEGRMRPTGDKRVGRGGLVGISFSRIPGVRRLRNFPADPRGIVQLPTAEERFEEKYQQWYSTWRGTRPEYIVFDYLENRKGYKHGLDFAFQSSYLGGRQRLGGSVVDFEVYTDKVFIRVQGERFHTPPRNRARDTLQAVALARTGYAVVDVWAIMVTQAPRRVIEAALKGITLREAVRS